MEQTVKVAAVGDNCMDAYDSLGTAYPGGNPVNVAVYIKRLGGEASYTGAVGTDENGKLMREAIAGKGVDVSHVQVLAGSTAVSHVELVNGDRVFGDYEEGGLADFKLREEDFAFLAAHDIAVTGIWGMIEKDLPRIRAAGVPTAFDFANKFASPIVQQAVSNVDYAFFSLDGESKEDFFQACKSLGISVSGEVKRDLRSYMAAIQKKEPKIVVVTLGEDGSLAFDGEIYYEGSIIPCEVVDTMGAGDSFIAGFLFGILTGMTIPKAMEAGTRNSSETLQYSGAR